MKHLLVAMTTIAVLVFVLRSSEMIRDVWLWVAIVIVNNTGVALACVLVQSAPWHVVLRVAATAGIAARRSAALLYAINRWPDVIAVNLIHALLLFLWLEVGGIMPRAARQSSRRGRLKPIRLKLQYAMAVGSGTMGEPTAPFAIETASSSKFKAQFGVEIVGYRKADKADLRQAGARNIQPRAAARAGEQIQNVRSTRIRIAQAVEAAQAAEERLLEIARHTAGLGPNTDRTNRYIRWWGHRT